MIAKPSRRTGRGRSTPQQRKSGAPPPRWRPSPMVMMAGLAVVVLGGLAVHPARTWVGQKQKLAEAQAQLDEVEAEVADLERQLAQLETDEEIERRARRDFHLVYPGEESYRILPGPDGG